MTASDGVVLRAEPAIGLLDEHVELVVEGAPPDAVVVLTARTRDESSRVWAATAEFRADAFGRVDVGKATSLGGSYTGVDPAGLFWAMTPVDGSDAGPFDKETAEPVVVEVEAAIAGGAAAAVEVRRLPAGPGVTRTELDLPGVAGYAFRPAGDGPFPGVLVLGGSGGALLECAAALLASRGLAAAAVSYFGRPGLPPDIADIPLEALMGVLRWLGEHAWVRPSGLGVVGTSKGGEAALLLGVHVPEVRAVACINGSGVHYQALTARGVPGPTWTLGGEAVGYLGVDLDLGDVLRATLEAPFESTGAFLGALAADAAAVARATIPVERIGGPLLLIAGEDDRVWPSSVLAERIEARMAQHGRADDVTVVRYPDAGHNLSMPNLPSTGTVSTRRGMFRGLGGTGAGNARAEADGWARQVEFLQRHLA